MLVKNPYQQIDGAGELEIPTATLQVYDFVSEYLGRAKDTNVNRASSAPGCPKKRWYQHHGYEGAPMAPRSNIVFLFGDLAEKTMNYFVKAGCVGPGKLYSEVDFGAVTGSFQFSGKTIELYKQEDTIADIGGIQVTAHADGWGKRNLDGKWELIEFKSASNFGFAQFKKGKNDYLKQAVVNLQTDKAKRLNATDVRFFFIRKETSHLWDVFYPNLCEPGIVAEVVQDYKTALQDEEPKAPYSPVVEMGGRAPNKKPTGRTVINYPCSYCPYVSRCQPKHHIEFETDYQSGNQKPTLVVDRE